MRVCDWCGLEYEPVLQVEHNGIHSNKRSDVELFLISLDRKARNGQEVHVEKTEHPSS